MVLSTRLQQFSLKNFPLFIFSTALATLLLWNRQIIPFWGDDYIVWFNHNFHNGFASSIPESLLQTGQEKYRPIFQLSMAITLHLFGNNLAPFVILNIFFLILVGTVIGAILNSIIGFNQFAISFGILLIATSRFTWFSTSHAIGLLETISAFFTVLCLLFFIKTIKEPISKNLVIASIFFGLAIFTHERYLLIGIFCSFFFLIYLKKKKIELSWYPFLPLGLVILNLAIKTLIFDVNILQGSHFDLAATDSSKTVNQTIQNVPRIMKSIFGFSEYAGRDTKNLILIGILAFMFTLLLLCAKSKYRHQIGDHNARSTMVVFMLGFALAAQIPASLEPALQERFLFIPYICLVICGIVFISNFLRQKLTYAVFIAFLSFVFFVYSPLRYTSDYSENSARVLYEKLNPLLNSTEQGPWYLIVRNYGVGLWMFGTMRNYEPGVLSQFPNPPIVFWEGTQSQIPNSSVCKVVSVDPIYLPQISNCDY